MKKKTIPGIPGIPGKWCFDSRFPGNDKMAFPWKHYLGVILLSHSLLPDATLSHMVKECRKLFSAFLCSKKRDNKSHL
jgi:hypothetical protein